MKRRLLNLLLIIAMIFGGTTMVCAQSKALKKDIKKTAKELKKDGWQLLANATTLEYALTKYRTYIEGDEDNRIAITGIAEGRNPKIGRENAIMNGISSYAARAKAQVAGKLKSVISSEQVDVTQEEIDNFCAAYEMEVNTQLSGLVKQHFVLVRNNGNKKDFQVYMSLDESVAKKARETAGRRAQQNEALKGISEQVNTVVAEKVEEE